MGQTDTPKDSIVQRLRNRAGEIHADAAEAWGSISGAANEEVKGRITELNSLVPMIAELGYSVDGIQIAIGPIPDVVLKISGLSRTMPEDRYRRVLEEHKDKPVLLAVVKALQAASGLHQRIHFMGMRSDTASVVLGLPPKVTLEFNRER